MPFKPNYRQDRAERTRNKQIRKMEKLREKEEQAARRKAEQSESHSVQGKDHVAGSPLEKEK